MALKARHPMLNRFGKTKLTSNFTASIKPACVVFNKAGGFINFAIIYPLKICEIVQKMSNFNKKYWVWLCVLLFTDSQMPSKDVHFAENDEAADLDFYSSDKVKTAVLNSVEGYIACSSKKKYFDSETAHQIRSFLQLEAQGQLVRFLTGDQNGEYSYKINSIKLIKEWNNADVFFASFFIPKNSIVIEKKLKKTLSILCLIEKPNLIQSASNFLKAMDF